MGALGKGCGTCKRRKVKCDETHPTCTRCRKAGIDCTGFAPRFRFVDEVPRIRRSIAVSQKKPFGCSVARKSSTNLAPFLRHTLSLIAFQDDIFISYLLSEFFEGKYWRPSYGRGETRCGLPANWIPELVKTPQKTRYKSWDALAALVFGQAHGSCDAVTTASKIYGQALSELRDELSSPINRCTDSTLASITALYLFEIFVSKTEKAWMSHANGLGWLLERRGPWQQKFYAGESIFLEHRIMLVAKSIISRQSTFLRDPVWKTVPWEVDPTAKSAIDYLVDIGADITDYLARIKTYDNSREPEYSRLRTQVSTSLEELNAWWHQIEANYAHNATEVTSTQILSKLPPFPTLLEYDTMWTAFTVCVYDAIRILLLQLWYMLQMLPNTSQAVNQGVVLDMPNRTALLGITSDTRGLACEILRSLTYCYRQSRRFISTFSFLFIQDVAYGCFDQDSQEAIWVARHGWAELAHDDDVEHANLLNRLLPSGQIRCQ